MESQEYYMVRIGRFFYLVLMNAANVDATLYNPELMKKSQDTYL